jgi:type II secretory pathway pseudopilin PulG
MSFRSLGSGEQVGVGRLTCRMEKVFHHEAERGYTLVALLALMTLLALMAMAAAPRVQQQIERERENEAIFRGEEVAEAIRLYAQGHGGNLPTSIDALLEGNPRGSQKIQILRPEAARDPLTNGGKWRLIGPASSQMVAFERAVTVYAGGMIPATRDPALQRYALQFRQVLNTGSTDDSIVDTDEPQDYSGPFIGVASANRTKSVISYYGIDRHNGWIFTPLFR